MKDKYGDEIDNRLIYLDDNETYCGLGGCNLVVLNEKGLELLEEGTEKLYQLQEEGGVEEIHSLESLLDTKLDTK